MSIEDNFYDNLEGLRLESFLNFKSTRKPTPETMKVGCSLIAIFFHDIKFKHIPNEKFELNSGINEDIYNFYYKQPVEIFRSVQKSEDFILDGVIAYENVKFAAFTLRYLQDGIDKMSGDHKKATQNIYDFLISFIQYYLYSSEDITSGQKEKCKFSKFIFKTFFFYILFSKVDPN